MAFSISLGFPYFPCMHALREFVWALGIVRDTSSVPLTCGWFALPVVRVTSNHPPIDCFSVELSRLLLAVFWSSVCFFFLFFAELKSAHRKEPFFRWLVATVAFIHPWFCVSPCCVGSGDVGASANGVSNCAFHPSGGPPDTSGHKTGLSVFLRFRRLAL